MNDYFLIGILIEILVFGAVGSERLKSIERRLTELTQKLG